MPDDYGQFMAGWARGSPIPWEVSNQLQDILALRGAMPPGAYHKAQELNAQNLMSNLGAINAMFARRGGAGSGMHLGTLAGTRSASAGNLLDLYRQWAERQQNQWRQDIGGLGFPFMGMQLQNQAQAQNFYNQLLGLQQQQKQFDDQFRWNKYMRIAIGLGGLLGGLPFAGGFGG